MVPAVCVDISYLQQLPNLTKFQILTFQERSASKGLYERRRYVKDDDVENGCVEDRLIKFAEDQEDDDTLFI
ncbi:hypothetical protein QVD17_35149 [Tagetes erecta]|uniref:Uncharacterized protein n=1 Tax=Tagetes erecta TaxID=13708 RepID=A0AAD8JZD1_TARER|nr:hypothetical protein QVD17_35149 [Tagetes erecta]